MNKNFFSLPSINENFSEWYQVVVEKSELASHSNVRGCMVILPYGYALWENIQKLLDKKIKELGACNMAFPLLIPYSLLEREKEHVDGFSPEIAVVTHAGGEELQEPLVVRPTSEVLVHSFFKEKIFSWRDLPLKINQWCSVIRWEKRPRLFLRTSEFWWQEGHCAFSTKQGAIENVMNAIFMYENMCFEYLSIPVIVARKPDHERFAGAEITMTIEGMMKDGKALQMGTSHLLQQSFSEASNITFQDEKQQVSFPFLTSWGVTTRLIGAIIMVHGDEKGLVLPPKIAPILFVIIPIFSKDDKNNILVEETLTFFCNLLSSYNFSFYIDRREKTLGEKLFDSEVKGYPFRVEIGIRDIQKGELSLFERDIFLKSSLDITSIKESKDYFITFINKKISLMHERMLKKAIEFKEEHTFTVKRIEEIDKPGFYTVYWCEEEIEKVKEKQLTIRCILEDCVSRVGCFLHDDCVSKVKVIVAKSY